MGDFVFVLIKLPYVLVPDLKLKRVSIALLYIVPRFFRGLQYWKKRNNIHNFKPHT